MSIIYFMSLVKTKLVTGPLLIHSFTETFFVFWFKVHTASRRMVSQLPLRNETWIKTGEYYGHKHDSIAARRILWVESGCGCHTHTLAEVALAGQIKLYLKCMPIPMWTSLSVSMMEGTQCNQPATGLADFPGNGTTFGLIMGLYCA